MEQLNSQSSIPAGWELITDGNFQDLTIHLFPFKRELSSGQALGAAIPVLIMYIPLHTACSNAAPCKAADKERNEFT